MKIVSIGFTEGFYYKPRIDMEVLEKYSRGLIALSACMSGDVPSAILDGNYEKAREKALQFNRIFGQGNFYRNSKTMGSGSKTWSTRDLSGSRRRPAFRWQQPMTPITSDGRMQRLMRCCSAYRQARR